MTHTPVIGVLLGPILLLLAVPLRLLRSLITPLDIVRPVHCRRLLVSALSLLARLPKLTTALLTPALRRLAKLALTWLILGRLPVHIAAVGVLCRIAFLFRRLANPSILYRLLAPRAQRVRIPRLFLLRLLLVSLMCLVLNISV
jgi:hypothetical protein